MDDFDKWFQNTQHHRTFVKLLRVLVEGKDNTREFLSMANEHLDLEVPSYDEIVSLYKAIDGKEV